MANMPKKLSVIESLAVAPPRLPHLAGQTAEKHKSRHKRQKNHLNYEPHGGGWLRRWRVAGFAAERALRCAICDFIVHVVEAKWFLKAKGNHLEPIAVASFKGSSVSDVQWNEHQIQTMLQICKENWYFHWRSKIKTILFHSFRHKYFINF